MTVVCERVGVFEALLGAGLVALTTGVWASDTAAGVDENGENARDPVEGGRRGCR